MKKLKHLIKEQTMVIQMKLIKVMIQQMIQINHQLKMKSRFQEFQAAKGYHQFFKDRCRPHNGEAGYTQPEAQAAAAHPYIRPQRTHFNTPDFGR